MEKQKNVPIDETFHDQLARIAILDKTSMKATVHTWIKKDGRGILQKQPATEPVAPKETS